MIKVLIVDDESSVRNGLLKYIHWDNLGIDSVCARETVEEALEYIRDEMPEIIISDIHMPGMNGIELCNSIRNIHPLCRIIFLSGYSDKEYLMGAIQLSADAYLEKPVNISEMEECLQKSVERCMKEQEKQKLEEDNQEKFQELCIRSLTKGHFNAEILKRLGRDISFDLSKDRYYQCIVLQIARDDIMPNSRFQELFLQIREIFQDSQVLLARKNGNQIVLLSSVTADELLRRQELDRRRMQEKLKDISRDIRIFGVISERRKGYEEIVPLYVQACADLQKVFYLGYGRFYHEEIKKETESGMKKEKYNLSAFKEKIAARNQSEAIKEADKLFDYYQNKTDILPNVVKDVFFRFILVIYQEVEKAAHLASNEDILREQDFLWEKINNFETMKECKQYLMDSIQMCMEEGESFSADNRLIRKVTDYVHRHFADSDLSVKEIADAVYLTPPYLSGIFRNKTGKTLVQYIKEVRLEYSIVLMEDGKLTLSDIAEKCGYADQNYYAKVFKKEYGLSPSEYRERVIR